MPIPINFASGISALCHTNDGSLTSQSPNTGYAFPASLSACSDPPQPDTGAALTGPSIHARSTLDCEDQLLVHLRDDLGKEWRESAAIFSMQVGRTHSVPALQMRYQRLQKKLRQWDTEGVLLLRRAHAYWKMQKWDLISQKMNELAVMSVGTSPLDSRWSAKGCAEKWHSLLLELGSP